jgi:hypothetical protein
MRRSVGVKDLILAVLAGAAIELALLLKMFFFLGPLEGSRPWTDYTQMPGAQIAIRLFRHTGTRAEAITCAVIIQGLIFAVLALGVIHAFRVYRERHGAQP